MKVYAVILMALTLLVGIVGLAQGTNDLKQKYGPPDDLGRYVVRPGVGMTVQFDEAGIKCDITVRPLESSESSAKLNSKGGATMEPDVAKAILDEVVPLSERGRYKGTGNAEFGCTSIDHIEYENVVISMTNRCDQQGGGTYSVRVHRTAKKISSGS